MIINKKKRKKGFTLVELIAVIAILAILGAILVPKITGYSSKASKSKDLANAKMLISAVELYNADNSDNEVKSTDEDTIILTGTTDGLTGTTALGLKKYVSSWPKAPVTKVGATPAAPTSWNISIDALRAYASALE